MIRINLNTASRMCKLGNSLFIWRAFSNLDMPLKSYDYKPATIVETSHYEIVFEDEEDESKFIMTFL